MSDPIIKTLTFKIVPSEEADIELLQVLSLVMDHYKAISPEAKRLVLNYFNSKYHTV